MASQTSIANTSYLEDCISKKKSIRDVHEDLGLYSETNKTRQDPVFYDDEANTLQKKIKEIAATFKATYRKEKEALADDLVKEDTLAEQVRELGEHYGPRLWGRLPFQYSPYRQQSGAFQQLRWEKPADQDSILFYIRCWIIGHVVQESFPRKGKARPSTSPRDLIKMEHARTSFTSDAEMVSNLPFRAPEVPCMLSTAQAPGIDPHQEQSNSPVGTSAATGSRSPTTPNKRKAPEFQTQSAPGKLQKMVEETRSREGSPRARHIYSVPRSPGFIGGLAQRGQREETCDSDRTWAPSTGMTGETSTVCDLDEVMADSSAMAPIHVKTDVVMPSGDVRSPTAGPSGTYCNPYTQDSVIPRNTEEDESQLAFDRVVPQNHIIAETPTPSEIGSRASTPERDDVDVSELTSDRVTKLRHELFKLLLSHLNSINQFSPDAYNPEAEERMNTLLCEFWLYDTEIIRARLGDRFSEVRAAWQQWMSMRRALSDFQHTTGYYGNPGEDWKEHLRRLDTVSHAKASIAYIDLQSGIGSRADLGGRFNNDLAIAFDTMTQVGGCTGVEEFNAVEEYNEALLGWLS